MPDPRLEQAALNPRLVRLARLLPRLGSTLRILVAGAHPDDEPSDMIARWSLGEGHRVHYVCVTRGQGGQNSIGSETGAFLGVLRSAEMALAAQRLGMSFALLDTGQPGDPLADFGFSKSAEDTLRRWGAEEVLRRLVREIRAFRPDIALPCFLDVPGQHGHHRAMTRTLLRAWEAAADPAFAPELGPVWATGKLYLPAWSGAGDSYDDTEPPPPVTTPVDLSGRDPVTGMSWPQVGEWSRAAHASQAMGVWRSGPDVRARPLHLLASRIGPVGPESDIAVGLPADLTCFGDPALNGVAAALDLLRAQFPHEGRMHKALAQARSLLDGAAPQPSSLAFRLEELRQDLAQLDDLLNDGVYSVPPMVQAPGPAAWLTQLPAGAFFNLSAPVPLELDILSSGPCPEAVLPAGWQSGWEKGDAEGQWRLRLHPPSGMAAGSVEIGFRFADEAAVLRHVSHHPHVGTIRHETPARLTVALVHVELPLARRVAVIDSGAGDLTPYLRQLGFTVGGLEMLETADAILIGAMGWRRRPDALARRAEIIATVARGARLVTLYHRPMDQWDPGAAVRPLTIGMPSLRYRACEPDATVEPLLPDHPLFSRPNRLTADDWQGWVRERGLYFAGQWQADDWQPLLSVQDSGESPLTGSLLIARHGAGAQVHCALSLHHQIPALVPGAARLLTNLLSPD